MTTSIKPESIKNNEKLLKTIRYGPMSVSTYREYRVEQNNENADEIKFALDKMTRENPYLHMIVEIVRYYLKNKDEIEINTQYMVLNRPPMRVSERKKMKKFGKALTGGNEGVTVIGTPVYITPVGVDSDEYAKKMNKEFKELEKLYNIFRCDKFGINTSLCDVSDDEPKKDNKFTSELGDVHDRINSKNANSKFKIFKPSGMAMNIMNKLKKDENESDDNSKSSGGFKKGGYLPPGMRRTIQRPKNPDNLFSLVVKNIPQHIDSRDVEKILKNMFNTYGDIHRVKVLRDNSDNTQLKNRGIAFIDYYEKDSVNNALSEPNTHTRIIEHMVLGVEEKKNFK
tara:strand:- start:3383 stop:4405 length:1023 start_codon:yes stop_codon:yes gene_type:complete